jgi:uncharacterized RDD family membrane protein YckC
MSFQNAPVSPQSAGALCAYHPASPAIATCTRCGSFICKQCYSVGADGNYYCPQCDVKVPDLAERGDRFVANLVDQFVIGVPWFVVALISAVFADDNGSKGAIVGMIFLLGALASLGVAGYQLYLVSRTGQTIGKRSRGIRVVRTDGSPASLGRILLLRNIVPIAIGSLCGLVSLIDALMIFGEERRCLHDMLADTKVVKVAPETVDR